MVVMKEGNILNSGADYICHQVNCQGVMNSGVAKAIREKWPLAYIRYMESGNIEWDENHKQGKLIWSHMLGHIQTVYIEESKCTVVNMFAQKNYGYDGAIYTSYDAFRSCLEEIKKVIPAGETIAFPYKIGCVRGGADWNIIYSMICEVLGKDFEVEFWRYNNG